MTNRRGKAGLIILVFFAVCFMVLVMVVRRNYNSIDWDDNRTVSKAPSSKIAKKNSAKTPVGQGVSDANMPLMPKNNQEKPSVAFGQNERMTEKKIIYEPSIKDEVLLQ